MSAYFVPESEETPSAALHRLRRLMPIVRGGPRRTRRDERVQVALGAQDIGHEAQTFSERMSTASAVTAVSSVPADPSAEITTLFREK